LVLRVKPGEELISRIREECVRAGIKAGIITGIGSLKTAKIGFLERTPPPEFREMEIDGPLELMFVGNVTEEREGVRIHLHATVSKGEKTFFGHLFNGEIFTTAEVFVISLEGVRITRKLDESTGLEEIDIDERK